ncbi:hypothetical protein [Devosia sp. A449]
MLPAADPTLAARYLELGATFVAVGTDVTLFSSALAGLAGKFKKAPVVGATFGTGY